MRLDAQSTKGSGHRVTGGAVHKPDKCVPFHGQGHFGRRREGREGREGRDGQDQTILISHLSANAKRGEERTEVDSVVRRLVKGGDDIIAELIEQHDILIRHALDVSRQTGTFLLGLHLFVRPLDVEQRLEKEELRVQPLVSVCFEHTTFAPGDRAQREEWHSRVVARDVGGE
jgi:hypothetical protein